MKKIFLLLFTFVSLNLFAQQANNLPENVKKDIETLQKADLNLSDIQISRITQVLLGQDELLKRNIKSAEGNKTTLNQRLTELKINKVKNIKGAMNEQQVEKFNALKLEEKF